MRIIAVAGALCLVVASTLAGQKTPKRPPLPAAADTCEPQAYFQAGIQLLMKEPAKAADAFYWASKLDPTWPEPLYARRVALLMADEGTLQRYVDGDRRAIESSKVVAIDSLQYRAFQLNPFLLRSLERQLLVRYVWQALNRASIANQSSYLPSTLDAQVLLARWVAGVEPEDKAWAAYLDGRYGEAAAQYGEAMKKKKNAERSWMHAERARAFFALGQMDSARGEMNQAIQQLRARDQKKLVFVYESKALYEQAIGLTYEMQGDYAAAREAYGRALQEDMSYHPAHVRTALVALTRRDTAAAVAAMEMARQIRADDPTVLFRSGELLVATGRHADAEAPLRRLIELEPWFAPSYFQLARALDAQGKGPEAATHYKAFLDRTWQRDPNRTVARDRLQKLGGGA